MLTHYPAIQPFAKHRLAVEAPHELYVEQSGNPQGIPVLFVHGGPGKGSAEFNRCYFNPEDYHIILFDQRGSGLSTPHAELQGNNTQALISDMEKIRDFLQVDQWVLFGDSWGATLSLLYAQAYPERVRYLVLEGIFLNRNEDVDWLLCGAGANRVFPEEWQAFTHYLPEGERHNPVQAYYERLNGADEVARMAAAKAWTHWQTCLNTLEPNAQSEEYLTHPHTALSLACIESHYFLNNHFLEPNQILNHMDKVQALPAIIVHGRYDMRCTVDNAWILHQAWPNSELEMIRVAGHAVTEQVLTDALIHATMRVASELKS